MNKYHITSTKFEGSAELVYVNGVLSVMDLSTARMSNMQAQGFKSSIPVEEDGIAEFSEKFTHTTIIQSEFVIEFKTFWKAYPYKRNQKVAEKVWNKMSKTDQVLAWKSASLYEKFLERKKQYPKLASTWLLDEEYTNDWKSL